MPRGRGLLPSSGTTLSGIMAFDWMVSCRIDYHSNPHNVLGIWLLICGFPFPDPETRFAIGILTLESLPATLHRDIRICVWSTFNPSLKNSGDFRLDLWLECALKRSVRPARVRLTTATYVCTAGPISISFGTEKTVDVRFLVYLELFSVRKAWRLFKPLRVRLAGHAGIAAPFTLPIHASSAGAAGRNHRYNSQATIGPGTGNSNLRGARPVH